MRRHNQRRLFGNINLPFDKGFDSHWQECVLICPIRFERPLDEFGKVQEWQDRIGWLVWSFKFGLKVSTAFHNSTATGVY